MPAAQGVPPGPDLAGRTEARPAFLQPGETPLGVQRRHPLSALDAWLGIAFLVLLACAIAFFVAAFVTAAAVPFSIAAAGVALALGLAAAVGVWFRVRTSLNVVTAERVYHAHGKLRYFLSQTTYDRVTDLHVHQSFFGRRFGFGTVLVQTAGHGVALVGVRDPMGTKVLIEEAREAMIRRLVAEHRRPAGKTAASGASGARTAEGSDAAPLVARPTHGGPPAWTGSPTVASVLLGVIPMAFVLVFALLFAVPATLAGGPFGLLFPAIMVVFVGTGIVRGLIQLRTVRYEVHAWGVAVSRGWLSRSRVEARYEKVTDVSVTQGILGRVFGYGTISINTAGSNEAPIAFAGVRDPDQVKALVDRVRQGAQP